MLKSMRINHLEYAMILKVFPPDFTWEEILGASIDYALHNSLDITKRHNRWIESLPQLRIPNKELKWEYKGFQSKQWTIKEGYYDKLLEIGKKLKLTYDSDTISVCLQNYCKYIMATNDYSLMTHYRNNKVNYHGTSGIKTRVHLTVPQEVLEKIYAEASKRGLSWRQIMVEILKTHYKIS